MWWEMGSLLPTEAEAGAEEESAVMEKMEAPRGGRSAARKRSSQEEREGRRSPQSDQRGTTAEGIARPSGWRTTREDGHEDSGTVTREERGQARELATAMEAERGEGGNERGEETARRGPVESRSSRAEARTFSDRERPWRRM